VRHWRPAALAPQRPAAHARHLCRCARLIKEDKPLRIEIKLAVEPGLAPKQDVGTFLLSRVRGFFYR
tara:strand:+ start:475 stop:675 length:201 start_codon:yes stop_codon:yes gene_type:complete